MNKTLHAVVYGRVQGVFFRAETEKQAKTRGLTGWVRNLPDGRVEVLASGDEQDLLQLHAWLKHGPPRAQVESVESQFCDDYQPFTDFRIEYS